jgi:hypothetical protein
LHFCAAGGAPRCGASAAWQRVEDGSLARRTKTRAAITIVLGLAIVYLFIAYFIVPAIWVFRDASRVSDFGSMVTHTEQDIPGDPINVGLVGTKEQVIRAFAAAGWDPADAITLRSSIDIGLSVVLHRPDLDAPVSALLFDGRKQDLAFEKPVGDSADQRNHVRFWLTKETGRPDVDAERNLVIGDLTVSGQLSSSYEIPGIGATKDGRNGGGDFTDGKALIGVLK